MKSQLISKDGQSTSTIFLKVNQNHLHSSKKMSSYSRIDILMASQNINDLVWA